MSLLTDEQAPEGIPDNLAAYLNRMFRDARLSDDQLPEVPREVGDTNQPAFQGNWSNFGGAVRHVNFYKDKERVHLGGVATHTGSGLGTTIFTLPKSYWPPASEVFAIITSGGIGEIIIDATGNVNLQVVGNAATDCSLSGVSFRILAERQI